MPEIKIEDQADKSRYVLEIDGQRAGLLDYRLRDGEILLTHAEVDPAMERRGLGSELTKFALDDARARGLAVWPLCPFVRNFVERNPTYLELVPAAARERLGF